MRYGTVERTRYGFSVDPWTYLDVLPSLVDALPGGARAFATDPGHYDFHGQRCVKDLKPVRLSLGDGNRPDQLTFELRHNCWKHEEDLTVIYHGYLQ
jgi:hypothetical protein